MRCPNCRDPRPGPGPFCMSCGARLSPPTVVDAPTLPTAAIASMLPLGGSQGGELAETSADPFALWDEGAATLETPAGSQASAFGAVGAEALEPDVISIPSAEATSAPAIGQMGSVGTVPFSIWGPFAGYGTRGRHVAWLMNDHGAQADALCDAVIDRFGRRAIPDAAVEEVILQRQGILVDSRPFFLIRRNLTTAGLYIARFGADLYVSQVTYFKGPISPWRVLLALTMFLFIPIYSVVYNQAAANVPQMPGLLGIQLPDLRPLLTLTCCLGPVYLLDYLALGLAGIYSIYRWLTDKDLLAALRVPPNEFDLDDTVALEKAVEQTVRESLDAVGIEQRLMPQALEYGIRRRLI